MAVGIHTAWQDQHTVRIDYAIRISKVCSKSCNLAILHRHIRFKCVAGGGDGSVGDDQIKLLHQLNPIRNFNAGLAGDNFVMLDAPVLCEIENRFLAHFRKVQIAIGNDQFIFK